MELKDANLYEADIIIATGLPLTWSGVQKQQFAAYLKQNEYVIFTYNGIDCNVDVSDVMIYPQGYAAIAPFAISMKGLSIVADIGNVFCGHCDSRLHLSTACKYYTKKDGTLVKKPRVRYVCYGKMRKATVCDGQSIYMQKKLDSS